MALNAGEPTTPPQSTTATQSTTPWVFVTPPASTTSPLSPFPSLIITPPVSTAPQWPLVVPSSSVVRKPGITSSLAIDDPHFVPLTCHGHSRPVTHISFGHIVDDGYYLVSACKDGYPMLRDGVTGDWIGTFVGHKGSIWSARLSSDSSLVATGSADFKAKIWNAKTGACLTTLDHDHVVKAVAFPIQHEPQFVATGGQDKRFRIFDISQTNKTTPLDITNGTAESTPLQSFELGAGEHTASIKSIVWNSDYNILTTAADDKTIRWWDLRTQRCVSSFKTENDITSCELSTNEAEGNSPELLSVAAGKSAYFFAGNKPGELVKKLDFDYELGSVAVNSKHKRFVTGGRQDFWVRVYDYDTGEERLVEKGHHGPIWSASYSPDGNIYATGSEDGTIKIWKACKEPYGLWS